MIANSFDIAWCAGLFEGEGCIYRCNKTDIRLQIYLTDHDVLARHASIAGGKVTGPYDKPTGRKPQWSWTEARQSQVRDLLSAWWPYLGSRRRARAIELGYRPVTVDFPAGTY